jgi:hypothetical protein
MPKNICVDLNVLVDIVLQRPGYEAARDVIAAGELGQDKLFLSAHEVTTFDYILKRAHIPRVERNRFLAWLLKVCSVIPTHEIVLTRALSSGITDYEDAVVEQAALTVGCSYIITRNVKDFKNSAVPALTPEAYLKRR